MLPYSFPWPKYNVWQYVSKDAVKIHENIKSTIFFYADKEYSLENVSFHIFTFYIWVKWMMLLNLVWIM